eukprot:SAG22_NODE_7265_length_756_cov_1.754947_1_plen_57_part_00
MSPGAGQGPFRPASRATANSLHSGRGWSNQAARQRELGVAEGAEGGRPSLGPTSAG